MPNTEKVTAVSEIVEHFNESSAAVITEYRGLTVKQISQLRRDLGRETTYAVLKNTLAKRAAAEAGVAIDDSLLVGPTAIAFVKGDPVEAAKGLRDFAKSNPLLVIKGGVLDGKALTPAELTKLADLESREVLLAKMAGALQASLQNAVSLFAAPLAQTARVIEALRQKAEQDPSVLRGGAGTPVAAQPEEETAEPVAAPVESDSTTTEAAAEDTSEAVAEDTTEAAAEDTTEG
jgi:large subunit ribosomal protein L10